METIKTLSERIKPNAWNTPGETKNILAASILEVSELRAALAKQDAQMLRMATCAGEFARDACKASQAESAPVAADELPPLPQHLHSVDAWVTRDYGRKTGNEELEANGEYFTDDQMRAYASAALAQRTASVETKEVGKVLGVWQRHGEAVISLPDPTAVSVGQSLYTAPPAQPVPAATSAPKCVECNGSGEQRGSDRGFPCVKCDGTGEALEANDGPPVLTREQKENVAFHKWWKESGHAADPIFTLTMENCAHATWQARALLAAGVPHIERDAARYRELRDHGLFVVSASGIGWAMRRDEAPSAPDEMDAAMDEHMRMNGRAAQQGEKGGDHG